MALESERSRRLELVLGQLEALPTLPAVAMRLLRVTGDDAAGARQIVEVVRGDPSLTAKVLAMCTGADKGQREPVTTLDRAVVMLGFEAIRNAVLSIKVFESFAPRPRRGRDRRAPAPADKIPADGQAHRFDRAGFWRHALAVAIAAEMIAEGHAAGLRPHRPAEAFVCGLLHDIGKLALEHLLPRSYRRVTELAERHQLDIAEAERKVIGLDHQTVGKRLAERWQLPHVIQDSIWLHGSAGAALPDLPHRAMVEVVGVADLVARRQHIGYSGNFRLGESVEARARAAGLDPARVDEVAEALHEELERRGGVMGLGEAPSRRLFLESIMQANAALGRLNGELAARRQVAAGRGRVLEAIVRFHADSTRPGRGVQEVLGAAAASAAAVFGDGYYALLYQAAADQPWLFNQYQGGDRPVRSEFIDPPSAAPELARLRHDGTLSVQLVHQVPWITDHVIESVDVRRVGLLSLRCGWGTAAVMLHDREDLGAAEHVDALLHTWGAAVAAATQHQGARRLGERLVEKGRELADAQHTLLRQRSMARLGEMAAGAAHEMNNPLAVISGRAQLLAGRLEGRDRADAEQIHEQAQRLSGLITALRDFADPPRPSPAQTTARAIVEGALRLARQRASDAPGGSGTGVPPVSGVDVTGVDDAPPLVTDVEHASAALAELLVNAWQSMGGDGGGGSADSVRLSASVGPLNGRLIFRVADSGPGMDAATLEHAFDPFFSAQPAGRRIGLGLARAQRLAEGLGGEVELASEPGRGTMAALAIPLTGADAG